MQCKFNIIFDLDGVIVDSVPLMIEAFHSCCTKLYDGKHKEKVNILLQMQGKALSEILVEIGFSNEFIPHYYKALDEKIARLVGDSRVVSLIEQLKKLDINLSIATGKETERAQTLLKQIGILQAFDSVIGSDLVKNSKPHPECVVRILEQHNYHKNHTVLVGDSTYDIEAAIAAGITALGARWYREDSFSFPEGIVVLNKPNDLLNLVTEKYLNE